MDATARGVTVLGGIVSKMIPLLPQGLVARVARRYIAGETATSAIELSSRLGERGFVTTLDVLGEDTATLEQAIAAADGYRELIASMADAGIERNVSLKLTQLGLRLDEDTAFAQLRRVIDAAAERDFFVRIDMEESALTDATLDFATRARKIWPRVGTVLQARLRRTAEDARRLAGEGVSFRLCKGIYPEPPAIAFQDDGEIRQSYMDTLDILLDRGSHVAVATHDLQLIERAEDLFARRGLAEERFEFQALLGVPVRATLLRLRDAGHTVRLYVPFGADWYAYGVRRLRENPKLAGSIAASLFSRERFDVEHGALLH